MKQLVTEQKPLLHAAWNNAQRVCPLLKLALTFVVSALSADGDGFKERQRGKRNTAV